MRRGSPRPAVLALVAALAAPWPAQAARLDDLEREASAVEDRLLVVERLYGAPDESRAARAQRKFAEGETQLLLGDWVHAAILLYDAVGEPELRATPAYPQALAWLGDALRNQGACGSALQPYEELLALGPTPARGAAVAGALECRVTLRRWGGLDALLAEIPGAFPRGAPAEVGYLAAKALYLRPDLRPSERRRRAGEAMAAVQPPFHLAAAYFQGVIALEAGDQEEAAERFDRCTRLEGKEARQGEIRELCMLALGRVRAEQGRWAESLDAYQLVPLESPRFDEAVFEVAWGFVKARAWDQALRTAGMIVDLAPDSRLAPEATILTGHLNLQLGHYAAAADAFQRVVAAYAPVRDDIDAVLTMHEDPIRYFNELIRRQGRAFDVASVLPTVAVKWANARREVGAALDLVASLEAGQRDLEEAGAVGERLEALLTRASGLDAAPLLKTGWSGADAAQNAVAALEGELATLAVQAARGVLPPAARTELESAHAARLELGRQLAALPRTPGEVQARQERMARRIDQADRGVFQLRYELEASAAALAGVEAWLEQHRAEIRSDAAGRARVTAEIQQQRGVLAGSQEELRALGREVAALRDTASGVDGTSAEAGLRREYRERVAREQALVAAARPSLPPAAQADLARADRLLDRLGQADTRALALKERFAAAALARADELLGRVAAERAALQGQRVALDGVGGDARDVIGRIAYRSFGAVRAQFYRLVLKADVGLIDVAWSRKRDRVEKIQALAQQKAVELDALDRDFKLVLREVD